MAFPPIEPKTYDMFRRVGTLSFSRLPFAEWEGFCHIVPYSAERGHFLSLPFKFVALHILYNCFTDFSLLNNFSGCIM